MQDEIYTENTTLRAWLAFTVAILVGGLLIVLSLFLANPIWQGIVREFGSLFLVAGSGGVVWELVVKRAFAREILALARLPASAISAGIRDLNQNFYEIISWESRLKTATEIDIFAVRANTWRSRYHDSLKNNTNSKQCVRLVLPDPEIPGIISQLVIRLGGDENSVRNDILTAAAEFKELLGDRLTVYYASSVPLVGLMRLDDLMVVTFLSHGSSRVKVPSIVCERGGWMFDFAMSELRVVLEGDKRITVRGDSDGVQPSTDRPRE